MPRLANRTFIEQHHRLRTDYLEKAGYAMIHLKPIDQLWLHLYFTPMAEEFTYITVLAWRAAVTKALTSLPQRAGRALRSRSCLLQPPVGRLSCQDVRSREAEHRRRRARSRDSPDRGVPTRRRPRHLVLRWPQLHAGLLHNPEQRALRNS